MRQRRMKVEYTMISADDHIDLGYLPKNLWTDRLPNSLKDRAPHVEDRGEKGEYWVCDGETWADYRGERWVCQAQSKHAGSRQGRSWRTPPADDAGKTAR